MSTARIVVRIALFGLLAGGSASAQVERDTLILRIQQTEPYRLVFYRVSDGGRVDTANYDSWHLAFEVPGFTAAIRANFGAGMTVWCTRRAATPSEWSALSLSDTLQRLHDSDTSWSRGAFNTTASPRDSFDLGWGNYNLTTHAITGDSLHILRLPDGSYRKLWLERLQSGVYYFKYANLDGSNEVSAQAPKSVAPRRSFVYYNLVSNQALNLEPADSLWDLVFTQYLTFLPPAGTPYPVVGALQNRRVSVARIPLSPESNPDTLSPDLYPYATAINTIGYDWKRFDRQNNTWLLADTVYYLIKTRNNEIWRLRFVGFGDSVAPGGARVRYTIVERKKVGQLPSSVEMSPSSLPVVVYPNPATDGVWLAVTSAEPLELSLYNALGQFIHEVRTEGTDFVYIPRLGWPAGLYWLRVRSGMRFGVVSIMFE